MSKLFLAALSLSAGFLFLKGTPALAQSDAEVQRINKWFDDNKAKQKSQDEYWKKLHTGPLQTPGKLQQAGTIQEAGTLQIPSGWQAIKATTLPCQRRFVLCGDTLFEFNKATLTPDAVKTLQLLLPELMKQRTHPVSIEGHTDAIGTDEYNMELSKHRAESVQTWLLATKLFDKDAVKVDAFGKRRPVASNNHADGTDNPEGRQKNRRVEVVINTCVTFEPKKDATTAQTPAAGTPDTAGGAPGSSSPDAITNSAPGTTTTDSGLTIDTIDASTTAGSTDASSKPATTDSGNATETQSSSSSSTSTTTTSSGREASASGGK